MIETPENGKCLLGDMWDSKISAKMSEGIEDTTVEVILKELTEEGRMSLY